MTYLSRGLLAAVLLASLTYNVAWYTSSGSILALYCTTHFAAVHAEAIRATERQDWLTAAHLYAYLIDYHPSGVRGCLSSDSARQQATLPLSALAWRWRSRSLDGKRDKIHAIDEATFRDHYATAITHVTATGKKLVAIDSAR